MNRLEIEFGRYSTWLSQAITVLDPTDRVPAACRGTGNPHLLEHMADALGAKPGMRILDVGAGLGGPGEWLRTERGCSVVGIDLLENGVRALRELFPSATSLVASVDRLPFRDRSFDGAWALGVLEMVGDKDTAVAEVARVLKDDATLAIYGFMCEGSEPEYSPVADSFETVERVLASFAAAGLATLEKGPAEVPPAPTSWRDATLRARAEVKRRHEEAKEIEVVEEELSLFNRLWSRGAIAPWYFVLRKERA